MQYYGYAMVLMVGGRSCSDIRTAKDDVMILRDRTRDR
jgi:hypothetical protein